jgi:YbbR domain-containing protein
VAEGAQIQVVTSKRALLEMVMDHVGLKELYPGLDPGERLRLITAALVSVTFVGGIWFSFTRGFESTATFHVPIEYMNRAPEKEIRETSTDQIQVNLVGSGALIRSIRPGQVQVRLDLNEAVVGSNTFFITQEDVVLPPGVVLKEIKPHKVEVVLDKPVQKELPVQVDWTGKLKEGLILAETAVFPDKITLIAGKQILDGLSTIYTERISLDTIRASGTKTAKLILQPASVRLIPGSRDVVTIRYVVRKRKP